MTSWLSIFRSSSHCNLVQRYSVWMLFCYPGSDITTHWYMQGKDFFFFFTATSGLSAITLPVSGSFFILTGKAQVWLITWIKAAFSLAEPGPGICVTHAESLGRLPQTLDRTDPSLPWYSRPTFNRCFACLPPCSRWRVYAQNDHVNGEKKKKPACSLHVTRAWLCLKNGFCTHI